MKESAFKKELASRLEAASRQAMRELNYHFKTPGHGWDLNFGIVLDTMIYDALGVQPESSLLPKLFKKYALGVDDKHQVVVRKRKGDVIIDTKIRKAKKNVQKSKRKTKARKARR